MHPRRLLPLVGIAMVLVAAAIPLTRHAMSVGLAVSTAAAVAGASGYLLFAGRDPWPSVLYGACLVGFLGVYALTGDAALGFFVAASFAVLRRPRRAHLAMLAVATVALNVIQVLTGSETILTLLATDAGILFFATIGWLLVSEQEQRRRSDLLVIELEAARRDEREAAALAERARVARDVHDVLAHTLSGLTIQLEAARMVASDASPALRDRIDTAQRLAREGLQEARRAVGALRGEEMPSVDIRVLAEEHRLATGTPVQIVVSGTETELASDEAIVLYRVVQEALSNIRKHAPGAAAVIDLDWGPERLRVEISNPSPRVEARGGWGLTGMRERAAHVGGRVDAGWSQGRFTVTLDLPARAG